MPEDKRPQEEETEPVVYASPVKRAWAWVGVVYMLLFLATFTYYLATSRILIGIGPLFLCPALGGLAATAILRCRHGRGGPPCLCDACRGLPGPDSFEPVDRDSLPAAELWGVTD